MNVCLILELGPLPDIMLLPILSLVNRRVCVVLCPRDRKRLWTPRPTQARPNTLKSGGDQRALNSVKNITACHPAHVASLHSEGQTSHPFRKCLEGTGRLRPLPLSTVSYAARQLHTCFQARCWKKESFMSARVILFSLFLTCKFLALN